MVRYPRWWHVIPLTFVLFSSQATLKKGLSTNKEKRWRVFRVGSSGKLEPFNSTVKYCVKGIEFPPPLFTMQFSATIYVIHRILRVGGLFPLEISRFVTPWNILKTFPIFYICFPCASSCWTVRVPKGQDLCLNVYRFIFRKNKGLI